MIKLLRKMTIDSTSNSQVTGILAVRLKSVKGLPKKGSGNTDCHDCGTKRLTWLCKPACTILHESE